jgi:hypothetical protein
MITLQEHIESISASPKLNTVLKKVYQIANALCYNQGCAWTLFTGLPIYRESIGEGQIVGMPTTVRLAVDTYNPYEISS